MGISLGASNERQNIPLGSRGWLKLVTVNLANFKYIYSPKKNALPFKKYVFVIPAQVPNDYKNSKLYRHEKRRFEYADRDVSGNLTLKEYVYFLHPEEGRHMLDCIVQVRLEIIDMCMNLRDANVVPVWVRRLPLYSFHCHHWRGPKGRKAFGE